MEILWGTIGSIAVLTVAAFFKLVFQMIEVKSLLIKMETVLNTIKDHTIEITTKLK